MIVIVLVLINRLHQGYRIADSSSDLIQDESWTLIQDERCLTVLRAVAGDLTPDNKHCVD